MICLLSEHEASENVSVAHQIVSDINRKLVNLIIQYNKLLKVWIQISEIF